MDERDHERTILALQRMAARWGRPDYTEDELKIWWTYLREWTDQDFFDTMASVYEAAESCPTTPKHFAEYRPPPAPDITLEGDVAGRWIPPDIGLGILLDMMHNAVKTPDPKDPEKMWADWFEQEATLRMKKARIPLKHYGIGKGPPLTKPGEECLKCKGSGMLTVWRQLDPNRIVYPKMGGPPKQLFDFKVRPLVQPYQETKRPDEPGNVGIDYFVPRWTSGVFRCTCAEGSRQKVKGYPTWEGVF